jgi:hypothetical protein
MSFRTEIQKLAEITVLTNKEIARVVGCSERTVFKYAGAYVDRVKKKSNVDESLWEIQKTVLLPDIHHPHVDWRGMEAVNQFICDYNPDELVYMGDQISLDCISFWNKKKPLLTEGKRLMQDYDDFNTEILEVHESITREDTRRTFMIGNHEFRVDMYCEQHPQLKDFIDIERHLGLNKRGYKIIPFNEVHQVGKLNVIHGYYWNTYHAKKTVDVFEGNVVYAHVHNPQMYTKISPIDQKGYHTATSLPCLCTIKPDYHKNAPNFWVNGFGIVEHLPATGFFNLYTVIIIEGSFMWNGVYYGKNI